MPGDFKEKFLSYRGPFVYNWQSNTKSSQINLINRAILSIFDGATSRVPFKGGNCDGVISDTEFANITEDDYNQYIKEMENYYKKTIGKKLECHIPSYNELKMLLDTDKPFDTSAPIGKDKKITQAEMAEMILPDGIIGQTEQEGSGDCYIESPLISLSCSTEGSNLIKRSIKPCQGGYEITLYGAEMKNGKYVPFGTEGSTMQPKTYFISQKKLKSAQEELLPNGRKKYNMGDPDTTLIAISIEQYRKDTQTQPTFKKNKKAQKGYDDYLSSGNASVVVQLLTGQKTIRYSLKEAEGAKAVSNGTHTNNKYQKRKFTNTKALLCLQACTNSPWKVCTFAASSKNDENIMKKYGVGSGHAFAVENVNQETETITLVNPWYGKRNEKEKITIPFSDFSEILFQLEAFDR